MKKFSLLLSGICIALFAQAQTVFFEMLTPGDVAGSYTNFTYAKPTNAWGVKDLTIPENSITGELAFVAPGTPDDQRGCEPLTNPELVLGKIAVVHRGNCEFGQKVLNAQNSGAIGVIIINNVDDAVFEMSGASVGNQDTIPVIFIDKALGEQLTASIEAGTATAFIGSKFLDTDLNLFGQGVSLPKHTALPQVYASSQGEFGIDPGFRVENAGELDQTGITATATLTKDGVELYKETAEGLSVNSKDSLIVVFPPYYPASFDIGKYVLTYTVTPSTTDEYELNNTFSTNFFITKNLFSHCPLNDDLTLPNNFTVYPTTPAGALGICTIFRNENADKLTALGINFYADGVNNEPITNEYVEVVAYEWNDSDVPPNTDIALPVDDLEFIGSGDYVFETDATTEVYVPFSDELVLQNNMRYVFCVKSPTDNVRMGAAQFSYLENINNTYQEPTDLVQIGDGDYAYLGGQFTAAISVFMDGESNVNDLTSSASKQAYPNPATDHVLIPISVASNVAVVLDVFDLSGKQVSALSGTTTSTEGIRVNTSTLQPGTYMVHVTVDGQPIASQSKIVITK